jgi:hypothetical protein
MKDNSYNFYTHVIRVPLDDLLKQGINLIIKINIYKGKSKINLRALQPIALALIRTKD